MISEEREERRSESMQTRAQLPRLVEALFYLVVALTFGIGVVWYNEGPPMVVVERQLLTPRVKPGGMIAIYHQVLSSKECPVEVRRHIIDSIGVIFSLSPQVVWPDSRIGRYEYTTEVAVPLGAAPGKAVYRVSATWKCNPLQQFVSREISLSDLEVEIIP